MQDVNSKNRVNLFAPGRMVCRMCNFGQHSRSQFLHSLINPSRSARVGLWASFGPIKESQ